MVLVIDGDKAIIHVGKNIGSINYKYILNYDDNIIRAFMDGKSYYIVGDNALLIAETIAGDCEIIYFKEELEQTRKLIPGG